MKSYIVTSNKYSVIDLVNFKEQLIFNLNIQIEAYK